VSDSAVSRGSVLADGKELTPLALGGFDNFSLPSIELSSVYDQHRFQFPDVVRRAVGAAKRSLQRRAYLMSSEIWTTIREFARLEAITGSFHLLLKDYCGIPGISFVDLSIAGNHHRERNEDVSLHLCTAESHLKAIVSDQGRLAERREIRD
jgi:hypothetical protein